ncbi:D-2-hydroxyacid dehydrogenase [Nitrosospira sp. Nsp13]|uniref:D-2-hydroxyacid dehydrogenase n=1 Tax=Nitrosospira sp. Nsp13 TaxID=1855332 RepID=UPI00088D3490|nr:D-2-hydroxyacid dehydrogenase [Nitrosospira sp. Nsp13]SCY33186.1 glycerate dehydrogenase [Nitrosospira sp. Nsp13]
MGHHVVFLERDSIKAQVRRPSFEHTYEEYAHTAFDQIVPRLRHATVAMINKVQLSDETLAELPKLKMIAVTATGYDGIDIAACRSRGIAVANIRNYAIHTVPEHVFALVLALRRNLLAYRQEIEQGAWQKSKQFCLFTHHIAELSGSTMGIVGEGAIGQGTAAIARGFGMHVLFAYHPSPKKKEVVLTPLDQVLAESDVLSLHCPLTSATRDLIGINELSKMKRSALLINTARGGLVDEAALVQALDKGLIAGAGFDVLTVEPPKNGNPLLDLRRPNFILTPHVAWASDEAMQSLADQLIDNIEAWVAGRPQNLVT